MIKHTLIFFLAFACKFVSAQVTANFTVDHTSGCSPLVVHFTDQSTGNITSRTWIFGNGNVAHPVPPNINPSASYGVSGAYTVKLIVSDGIHTDSIVKVNYITVFGNPQSNFIASAPLSGCVPLSVNFTSSCTQADGPITTYLWDFGDGSTGASQNISHTYISSGSFPVSLEITDSHGCSDTKLIPDYISASPLPVVSFSADHTGSCIAPLMVNYANNSTGTGSLSYQWSFGDGTFSNSATPAHSYASSGSYNVTLKVTDINGCQATLVKPDYIQITTTHAEFDFFINDTVCLGSPVMFVNNSVGAYSYLWNFGDGNTSSQYNPIYTYSLPGTYQIKLSVSAGATCRDSVTHTFFVEDVAASFSAQPLFACDTPAVFYFTDLSVNPNSWQWKINNQFYSAQQNPSFTLHDTGSYDVSLIATSLHGCKDTLSMPDYLHIQIPKYKISANKASGCIPLIVNFADISIYNTPYDHIAQWQWNFGDPASGANNFSSLQNPTHVYADTGHFVVSLTITTAMGCSRTLNVAIMAGIHPQTPAMTHFPDSVCASDGVTYIDVSTDVLHNSNVWYFSDSTFTVGDSILHTFRDTGIITAVLTIFHNGCESSAISENIYSKGPIANFIKIMNCDTPLVLGFIPDMIDEQRWEWNFGDSVFNSDFANINHTYTSGDYRVVLTAFNDSNGCRYKDSLIVNVRNVKALFDITTPAYGCEGYLAYFNPAASVDYGHFFVPQLHNSFNFMWDFGDGSGFYYSDSTISHQFLHEGTYSVSLIVIDINGCTDTLRKSIKIYKPHADFTSDLTSGCSNFSIHFIDQTPNDTILSRWHWSFGNGTFASGNNPTGNYSGSGSFSVSLIVIDTIGCSDTIRKLQYITSTNPAASFYAATSTNICSGDSVRFLSSSSGSGLIFLWEFGDGNVSAQQYPWHQYQMGGIYSVKLTVTDFNGCQSIFTKPDFVKVEQTPDVNFSADTIQAWCYPQLVHFTDLVSSPDVNTWSWNFGDGATSPFQNPEHNYTLPGVYTVKLSEHTPGGCKDSITKPFYIRISGPYAQMSHYPDSICKGSPITFTMTGAQNVSTMQWDFGDGNFGTGSPAIHRFYDVGILYPRLLYSDSANYCQKYAQDTIYIQRVIANFSANDTVGCVPMQVQFANHSVGASNYQWNFGDGMGASDFSINHIFSIAGTYTTKLQVTNFIGCTDTVYQQIIVHPLPMAYAGQDSLICRGDTIQLTSGGGITYKWTPATYLNSDIFQNPLCIPDLTTNYTVEVTDQNGCKNSKSLNVIVQQVPINIFHDTSVVVGEILQLVTVGQSGVSYQWSPDTGLSCSNCPNPEINILKPQKYTVTMSDSNHCFVAAYDVFVDVLDKFTIDVPKAFTPNSDNSNDKVFVRGLGIRKLLSFNIYNRWGQLVFTTDDIKNGWDGTYNSVAQNMDTYAYTVQAEAYNGQVLTKKGYIILFR